MRNLPEDENGTCYHIMCHLSLLMRDNVKSNWSWCSLPKYLTWWVYHIDPHYKGFIKFPHTIDPSHWSYICRVWRIPDHIKSIKSIHTMKGPTNSLTWLVRLIPMYSGSDKFLLMQGSLTIHPKLVVGSSISHSKWGQQYYACNIYISNTQFNQHACIT